MVITVVKKAEVAKKKAPFNKSGQFFRDVIYELKKVQWPTRKQLLIYTGIVLVAVAVMGVLIWLVDSFLTWMMALILK